MVTQIKIFFKKNIYLGIIFINLLLALNSFNFFYIDLLLYTALHILFVFYCFYDDFKINYLSIFIIGFSLDIFLVNEFGPHLITFMFFYLFINKIKYIFINKGFLFLIPLNILLVLIILVFEKLFLWIVYNYKFNAFILFESIIISIILSYPIYFFLNMIKNKL